MTALRLWSGAAIAIAMVAVLTQALAPAAARSFLGFTFPEREAFADFAAVAAHNLGLATALFVAGLCPTRSIDRLIAASCAVNVALGGLALGGYGTRFLEHAGLYGAIELAAFSVALATYLEGHIDGSRPRPPRHRPGHGARACRRDARDGHAGAVLTSAERSTLDSCRALRRTTRSSECRGMRPRQI